MLLEVERYKRAGVEPVMQTHGSGAHPEGRIAKQSMPLLHGGTGAGRGPRGLGWSGIEIQRSIVCYSVCLRTTVLLVTAYLSLP